MDRLEIGEFMILKRLIYSISKLQIRIPVNRAHTSHPLELRPPRIIQPEKISYFVRKQKYHYKQHNKIFRQKTTPLGELTLRSARIGGLQPLGQVSVLFCKILAPASNLHAFQSLQSDINCDMSERDLQLGHQSTLLSRENPILEQRYPKYIHQSTQKLTPILNGSQNEKTEKDSNLQSRSRTVTSSPSGFKKTTKKTRKKRSFSNHNFQKHTVVTVKKLGQDLATSLGPTPPEELAKRIWLIFLSSDITSKKILLILFGEASFKKEACKILFRECYLGEICICEQTVVQQAQNILRVRFLTLVNDDLIRAHTKRARSIYHKQEFIAYFICFVQQLRKGPLLRNRIGSETKRKIEKRILVEKWLSRPQVKRSADFLYQQLA